MTARTVRGRIPWNQYGADRKAYPPGSIQIPVGARMMLTDQTLRHPAGKIVSTRDTPDGLEVVAALKPDGLGAAVLSDLQLGAAWFIGAHVDHRRKRLLAFTVSREQSWPGAEIRLDAATGIPPAPRVDLSPLPPGIAWWATSASQT